MATINQSILGVFCCRNDTKKRGKSTYDPNRYLMTLSDHTGYKWWRNFHRTTHECWLSVASWCQIRMDTEPLNWLLLAPRKTWNSLANSSCSCWTIRRKPDPVDWNTKTIITFRFSVYLPKKQSRYAQSTMNLDHVLGTPWVPYLSVWFPVTPWWLHPARGDKDYSRCHRKRDSPGDAGDGPRESSALNAPDVAETTTIWLFNSSPWKIPNKWRFIAGTSSINMPFSMAMLNNQREYRDFSRKNRILHDFTNKIEHFAKQYTGIQSTFFGVFCSFEALTNMILYRSNLHISRGSLMVNK